MEESERNGRTMCEGKDERSGEPRERRHPRAHFRFGAVEGDEKGGANSRDINSVLALGGLQRRKLRAEGEYCPLSPASPCNPRVSIPPSLFPPCPAASTNVTTLGAQGWEGVTNQRLAIVNSTCAVKQLINKRLFTSCARGVLARTQSERIFPPRDDECGADNAAGHWTTRGRSGLKLKNAYLCSEIVRTGW